VVLDPAVAVAVVGSWLPRAARVAGSMGVGGGERVHDVGSAGGLSARQWYLVGRYRCRVAG